MYTDFRACQSGFGLNHVAEEILSVLSCQGSLPTVCTISGLLLEVGIPEDRAVVECGLLPTRKQRGAGKRPCQRCLQGLAGQPSLLGDTHPVLG